MFNHNYSRSLEQKAGQQFSRSVGAKLLAGIIVVAVVSLTMIVWIHSYLVLPNALNQKQNELSAIFEEKVSYINGLTAERERFALSLASIGEQYYQLNHKNILDFDKKAWEGFFSTTLQLQMSTFAQIVGAGIWFEPYAFDPKEKYRGYYIEWRPAVGEDRKLNFTMDWSSTEADYHNQEWYLSLLAKDSPRDIFTVGSAPVWTAPYKDPVTGVLMITVDAPIHNSEEHVVGMSTVDWNLDQVQNAIKQTKPTLNSRAFLLDGRNFHFIAVSDTDRDLRLKPLAAADWAGEIDLGSSYDQVSKLERKFRGENYWYFTQRLASGMLLGLMVPKNEALSEILAHSKDQMYALMGCMLLSLGLLVAISRLIFKEQLGQVALARDRAIEASKLRSVFLANMSHEIRTPMNGVLGMLELALESNPAAEIRDLLNMAQESAKSLLRVINDILDLSKIESGKFQLLNEVVDMKALLTAVVTSCEFAAKAKDQTILFEMSDEFPRWCFADPVRLRQVLINLIGNAVKFNTTGGGILVLCDKIGEDDGKDVIRISIADTGQGIAPDKLESIFEAFTQADNHISRVYGGTGLGLTISRSIINQMGGFIEVDSREGRLSVFRVIVSIARAAAPAQIETKTESKKEATPSLDVLVAEDTPINQHLIVKLLQKMGHKATLASNGKEALDKLCEHRFDIVLMDIQMPVMDGSVALKQILSDPQKYSKVPVVALTAHAMDSERERFMNEGFSGYVSKPIDSALLAQTLVKLARPQSDG